MIEVVTHIQPVIAMVIELAEQRQATIARLQVIGRRIELAEVVRPSSLARVAATLATPALLIRLL